MVKKPTRGKKSAPRARTQKVLPDAAPAAVSSSKTDRCLTVEVVAVLSTPLIPLIEYDSITGDAAAAYAAENGEWTKQPLGLTSLPDDIAEILARRRDVSLPRLQELSAGAARHLARVSKSLWLPGLVALSKEAAVALSAFAGERCLLRDLTQITDEAAEILAENRVISLPDRVRQRALFGEVLTTLFPARQPPGSEGRAIVNSVGMTLLPVAPGRYLMGSAANDPLSGGAEEFQHAVEITRRFYMGAHQVTQAVYCQLVGSNPSRIPFPTLPVHGLSWQEAAAFCELVTALPDEQAAGRRYRLPSEAEWEYACRAGTDTTFHTGEDLGHQQARFSHNWQATPVPVGSYEPNQWGFFDMHGNVWEWTQDWFASDYYQSRPSKDPIGPSSGSHHTMRGGSAACRARECPSAGRGEVFADGPCESPYGKAGELGMRVVCEVTVAPR